MGPETASSPVQWVQGHGLENELKRKGLVRTKDMREDAKSKHVKPIFMYSPSWLLGRCLISGGKEAAEEFQAFCFCQNEAHRQLCALKSELKQK